MYVDPTKYRLSPSFLLSDFMGCTSVYRYGYCNRMQEYDIDKLREGVKLANTITTLELHLGPASVCYGYISPELSRKIVTYQSPDKPSYHRWDAGAAADITFPRYMNKNNYSAIEVAFSIERTCENYSRMITYAESPWICFATKRSEQTLKSGFGRRAFYENRYVGARKPLHVKYSDNPDIRRSQMEKHTLDYEWEGSGWPQYHLRGVRQLEHYHVGKYCTYLSFLYDKYNVHSGRRNLPPYTNPKDMERFDLCARMASETVEGIIDSIGRRVSIIRGYDARTEVSKWSKRFVLEVVPDTRADINHCMSQLDIEPYVHKVRFIKRKPAKGQSLGGVNSIMIWGVAI